jgi:two-component system sensor kinase FixL
VPAALRLVCGALLVLTGYYAGAELGLSLTFRPNPISVLWPPNAILLAALLLAPRRAWPWLLLAAFPAHLLAELQDDVPVAMVLCWFASNASEALIGAVCVCRLAACPLGLDRPREIVVFLVCGVLAAPFLSSFLDAGFVILNGFGTSTYWELWETRFRSNMLATLTLVPAIVTLGTGGLSALRNATPARILEGLAVAAGLVLVGVAVFDLQTEYVPAPAIALYLPLPFLIWGALRFGPQGASVSFATVAVLAIWGAAHGRGPFVTRTPAENAVEVQLFLGLVGATLLVFAAFMQERKRLELILRSSEERFATAFHSSPDAMAISRESDGRFVEVNERWLALFSHRRDDVVGRTLRDVDLFGQRGNRDKLAALSDRHAEVQELELELKTSKDEVIHAHITTRGAVMEGERCFITIIRDDSERVRARTALRESEERFRTLADIAPVNIWMCDVNARLTFVNKRCLEFTGSTPEREFGRALIDRIHPQDLERCEGGGAAAYRPTQPFEHYYRRRRHDGVYRWMLGAGVPRTTPDGVFIGYVGTSLDITERKESEDILRLALEGLPVGILIVNARGEIALANAQVEKLFGYAREELIGGSIEIFGCFARRDGGFAMPETQVSGRHTRRKDGSDVLVEIGSTPIHAGEEPLTLVAIADVTDRYELQRSREELTHMGRISVMGELAASLTHELNQPLTAILSNVQAAQRWMSTDPIDADEVREILKDIVEDDRRASDVIRHMRTLVRKGEIEVAPLDLCALVRDVAMLVQSDAVVRGVRLSLEIDETCWVNGDKVQLQQVMLTLRLNAVDAMNDSPRAERAVCVRVAPGDAGTVRAAVSDRGTGLTADQLDKIFTPFFTSKRDGLGLGLSISRSIVEAHGGRLRAENNFEGGATFHFALPALA